jgi:hypothetical protein
MVIDTLEGLCRDSNIQKIFMVGRFSSEQIFWEEATTSSFERDVLTLMTDDGIHTTSRGAVTFGLRVLDSELPVIIQQTERQYIPDPPISKVDPNMYKFVVGIGKVALLSMYIFTKERNTDFGTTYSGCSYALSTASAEGIKTIKKW